MVAGQLESIELAVKLSSFLQYLLALLVLITAILVVLGDFFAVSRVALVSLGFERSDRSFGFALSLLTDKEFVCKIVEKGRDVVIWPCCLQQWTAFSLSLLA